VHADFLQAAAACNGAAHTFPHAPQWRGSRVMGVSAQTSDIRVAIAVWDWPSYFSPEEKMKGIRLSLAKWKRPSPETIPCEAKAAGLYMICTLSKHEAEKDGYADAMMLDYRGYVAEATGANIFFVKDGKIHTPLPDCFLNGITRQTVIKLARDRQIEVIERHIKPEELSGFEQCFLTGSAAEVTPVSEIANWKFKPGDISKTLMDDYKTLPNQQYLYDIAKEGDSYRLTFEVPAPLHRFIAQKGSVTLNGVSLTVNGVTGQVFDVMIIPHTWTHTNFKYLQLGEKVNLEIDLLARYMARLIDTK
jgi:branched-chain amino acid aminotransferase